MGGKLRTRITSFSVLLTISFTFQFCDGFSNFSDATSAGIAYVCQTLLANHSAEAPGVTVQDPFSVTVHVGSGYYTPGTSKNITVSLRHTKPTDANSEATLKGFVIQARRATSDSAVNTPEGLGTWLPNEHAEVLDCGGNSTAIVQRDGSVGKKLPITVMFNAPPINVGSIVFLASWVENLTTHTSRILYSTGLVVGTPCQDSPCRNGGECTEDFDDVYGRGHNCSCQAGTTGINCEEYVCTENTCGPNQLCQLDVDDTDPEKLYLCNCDKPGYSGENCDEGPCTTNQCLNGGTCYETNIESDGNYYFCSCPTHFSGENCEIAGPCANEPCNIGSCILDSSAVAGFTCDCSSVAREGTLCEFSSCLFVENLGGCKNGGTCYRDPNDNLKCSCPPGYVTDDCSLHICDFESGPCSPINKQCIKESGGFGYGCNCTILFTNYPSCDELSDVPSTCDPDNPCQNGGTCTTFSEPTSLHPLPFDCECTMEYKGEICDIPKTRCEIAASNGHWCRNEGVCNNDENEPLCMCPYGFNDTYCQNDYAPPGLICENLPIPGEGLHQYMLDSFSEFRIDVSDNSKGFFISSNPQPPFLVQTGVTYVFVKAWDLFSNLAECSFQIILPDTIPPNITCPLDTTYTSMPGEVEADIVLPEAYSTDNYGNITLTTETSFDNITAVPLGTYSITVVAKDQDGNNNSCYYWIHVEVPQLLYVVFSVNETFVDAYNNASSPVYEAFILRVKESMLMEMSATSFSDAYSGLLINDLRSGSVEVNAVVMMNSKVNISDTNTLQDLTNALNDSVMSNGQLGNMDIIEGSFGVSDDVCFLSPCLNGGICLGGEINDVSCDCSNTGYEGQICDVKIDYCANSPCQNGGTCTNGNLSFTCNCSVDFTGESCQTSVNHCADSPCNNGGTCISGTDGAYTCNCTVDYTGDYCDTEVDHCAVAPCQNNGTCTSEANGLYNCTCTVDYTGDNCEQLVDHCADGPCSNGGTCTSGTQGTFTCACTAGFTGDTCDTAVDLCADDPCQNGGNCTSGADGYTCACTEDFKGDNCTDIVDHCATRTTCNNGGTCNLNEGGGFNCTCTVDYTGRTCSEEVDHCDSEPCQNGAACISQSNGRFICSCADGFMGETCADTDPCNPNPCQNGGNCNASQNGSQCQCPSGFRGSMCQDIDNPCDPNPCQNDGTCVTGAPMFFCLCGTGFSGQTCTELPCDSSPCQNNGTCDNVGDGFSCTCDTGFVGDTCADVDTCESSPCQNGGVCTVDGDSYVCNCTGTNYTGTECQTEVNLCNPNPCFNGGLCSGTNQVLTCNCPTGFEGELCEIEDSPCDPNPCANNNTCVVLSESGQYNCSCGDKWGGERCEIDLRPCDSSPCSNSGNCTNLGGGDFNCTCDEIDWTGPYCEKDLTPCTPNPCSNMGNCTEGPEPGTFNCTCNETEWTGDVCDIDVTPCDPFPCLNGGNCTEFGAGNFSCMCEENQWTGETCEIDVTPCDPFPCLNGGNCTEFGAGNFSCMCEENQWTGETCEIDVTPCDPFPCLNGGNCTEFGAGNFSCMCEENQWTGETCEIDLTPCDPLPCENNGTCIESTDPGNYSCNCTEKWVGQHCEIYLFPCELSPCQNSGTCQNGTEIGSHICTCAGFWEGTNCETLASECTTKVCRNGGTCSRSSDGLNEVCDCISGFAGDLCETDSVNECDSNPCQNSGTCVNQINKYSCQCGEGFEGNNCETRTVENEPQTAAGSSSWWIIALCICFLIIIGVAAVFVCVSMSKKTSS